MEPEAASGGHPRDGWSGRTWVVAVVPLALLAGLVAVVMWMGPAEALRGRAVPAVEVLSFQRVALRPDGIVATVLNDGPDEVTIAQVVVDDAFWGFAADAGTALRHLERTTLSIPYPWVEGEAHVLKLVTSTGLTFEHEIPVAIETPTPDGRFFAMFTLIGLYVGVIPVTIGLLWYPLVGRLGRSGLDFVLALTIGLLVFLLAEAGHEGLEAATSIPQSYQGVALFVFGAVGAFLGLETLGEWLRRSRRRRGADRVGSGWVMALLVAIGIGLHNFGEGLAIGAAFSLGEVGLGTMLIVGFMLHNTTEGLAIVAPLARERVGLRRFVELGVVGGAPTIAGAWLGGLVYSPVWSVVFLSIGAGAIAQVVVQIARQMAGAEPVGRRFASAPILTGLMAGFVVMYATGLMVG